MCCLERKGSRLASCCRLAATIELGISLTREELSDDTGVAVEVVVAAVVEVVVVEVVLMDEMFGPRRVLVESSCCGS